MILEGMIDEYRTKNNTHELALIEAKRRMRKIELRSDNKCSDCGATLDAYGIGHTFSCKRRGCGC